MAYYRVTHRNKGIFDCLRLYSTKENWEKFHKSKYANWLPIIDKEVYDGKVKTYFTEKGYRKFNEYRKYYEYLLGELDVEVVEKAGDVKYEDELQIVF